MKQWYTAERHKIELVITGCLCIGLGLLLGLLLCSAVRCTT